MAANRQKLRLLYLYRILTEQTDAQHGLTMAQILEKLEEQGISAERKAIYRDLDALREFGLQIEAYYRNPVEYGVAKREFSLTELSLLVDALQSTRFLTQEKCDELVVKIKQLTSSPQQEFLEKRIHVQGRIKMQEESIFHNVDLVQEALAQKRKLSFYYFKHDVYKRRTKRRNGARYIETPVQLLYAEGLYYLIAYNEKHASFPHYRVDRMDDVVVLDDAAIRNERIANYEVEKLEAAAFGMYGGESISTVLLVGNESMDAVLDRFGKEVDSVAIDDQHARVYVRVIKSPTFFGWLAQFGARVRIEKPVALAREYQAFLGSIMDAYK